ncbi:hypothetical protein BDV93DRAFT_334681 [Ceratobasidium sp. AG-I]|nr:hypothetical protein BDV93DRAFT_334681 [Ceratobasidium sp. AG-I]
MVLCSIDAGTQDPRTFIRTSTPIEEAFQHLLDHGCVDITPKLDLPRCSRSALSGGTFGDVWYGVLRDQTRVAIKCLRLHAGMETMVKHTKRTVGSLGT